MGMSKVNIFIVDSRMPCMQDLGDWYVKIFYCSRDEVKLCEFDNPVKAPCGHAEFELPPGCYIAVGYNAREKIPQNISIGIFQVCCDKTTCLKLFPIPIKTYLTISRNGLEVLGREELISRNAMIDAQKSLDAIIAKIPVVKGDVDFPDISQLTRKTRPKKK